MRPNEIPSVPIVTPDAAPDQLAGDIHAISRLPSFELQRLIGPELWPKAFGLIDWLLSDARFLEPSLATNLLCERLVDLNLPLDRYGLSVSMLHAELDAIGRSWLRGRGASESIYVRGEADDTRYQDSPYRRAAETRRWVELWLPTTPDATFGIVAELKKAGYVHYFCIPIFLINGAPSWVTLATLSPSGFSRTDIAVFAFILPALSGLIEMRVAWNTLDNVLKTYVGNEPRQAILAGNVKRGQVSEIRSAILFADMRDSSIITADMNAVAAVNLFNQFFDCLVPPIERNHGEVLKYLGDGLLAIFRQATIGECDAHLGALNAAGQALHSLDQFNRDHPQSPILRAGIALHFGEAAYGNVGSGTRLDFTVIGRDVGLASRIADLTRTLNEPLLMSQAFVERLGGRVTRLGPYRVRGFAEPISVYRPASAVAKG
jgi:adenylate cyclase